MRIKKHTTGFWEVGRKLPTIVLMIVLSCFAGLAAVNSQEDEKSGADQSSNTEQKQHTHTNALVNETSPYLLMHAHNPVNWIAWNN